MSQNETIEEVDGLSLAQHRAINALLAGSTITAASEAVGVARQTLHRWLRDSYAFQAALNTARMDLREEVENRLQAVATEAIEVVDQAVRAGDARTALAILRGLGLLDGKQREIGGEDPDELQEDASVLAQQRKSERVLRRVTAF